MDARECISELSWCVVSKVSQVDFKAAMDVWRRDGSVTGLRVLSHEKVVSSSVVSFGKFEDCCLQRNALIYRM